MMVPHRRRSGGLTDRLRWTTMNTFLGARGAVGP